MGLLRTIFWLAIFVASTFVFTVIFEHGPMNFSVNAKREYESLSKMFGAGAMHKSDTSDTILK